jgi:hypothetical protein
MTTSLQHRCQHVRLTRLRTCGKQQRATQYCLTTYKQEGDHYRSPLRSAGALGIVWGIPRPWWCAGFVLQAIAIRRPPAPYERP